MSGKIFIVDSFTAEAFKGNPAGVHLIDEPIGEARMQAIARELNLSETAFVSPIPDSDEYAIRLFFTSDGDSAVRTRNAGFIADRF